MHSIFSSMVESKIQIIPSKLLNKEQWDDGIYNSHNGLIYATSVYLDYMCGEWLALVMGDWDFIMPLPIKKKWFIQYAYVPGLTQQLGIFSNKEITIEIIQKFIQQIEGIVPYADLNFNYACTTTQWQGILKKNYVLPLQEKYEQLKMQYSRSALRNIRKATQMHCTLTTNVAPADIIQIHRKRFKDNISTKRSEYAHFNHLCNKLSQMKQCFTAGALNIQGQLIAGSIYLKYRNRLVFILNGNTPESLQCGATHLLKDFVIQTFAGSDLVMDFEGSEFPNFARFYEQFGAKEAEHYSIVKRNNLPIPFKWLKK